ncbi:NAD-dependent epimerase/dehydratase family protein [Vibrio neptunius]|uniref:NAD-dependent epimerase/dehydratase family protein n=1 Tax=Vibrio neptunius TaxID=170651 RepID=A0ABS3A1B2_9VIBR|nr:NAD-dependent epimerase/dehydratase family protein [Vibrio neptunius]MBN3493423.1 NAD-dependent epimerase/dehydratase family protein [Vibrio neptunius]MBN3515883.1 NAD-dependent epimerase/dehydratase family protein [Vibrio neptunius]MBN3550092.1 NAD-dependent epimerase/dehydratase family protein [Vibrio neptunius]MBN3578188.1 NAD-dependent epimerase/dehydratase family protein [Vibrio neptunius]MCH9871852.1 NAD-dependent epimerase/dehydratase family protein [Vibrio neptunius]
MRIHESDLSLISEHLEKDISYFRNKKIFITGGTGFFGKWLLETFKFLNENNSLNVSLTILTRSPEKFERKYPHLFGYERFRFFQGDVRDFEDLEEDFDIIIHAATDASAELNRSEPDLMRSTIMDGTKRVCDFAERTGCKRILYTSSGAAYGPQPDDLASMPETFLDNPLFNHSDAYASAKLESETYFKENASCEVVIARCFAFSGPYLPLDGSYAFGNFILDALNEKNILINGDGTAVRSYLYAADLVIWLLRMLSSGRNKEIYNVGSPEGISIFELAYLINNLRDNNAEVKVLGKASSNKNQYVPDVSKAESELNLKVYTSLKSAINKTLDFYSVGY